MTRATLLALAARVEQSEGADRQIDAEIVWRTTPGIVGIERGPLDDDGLDFLFEWWPRRPWSASWLTVPAFTASLDAAASLLKPHQRVSVVVQHETYTAVKVWDARVAMFVGSSSASGEHAEPRARTAAALRAMAEEAPHE